MPNWKKDAREFTAAVHRNKKGGYCTASVPKPVTDNLGKGGDVEAITYATKGKRVEVERNIRS